MSSSHDAFKTQLVVSLYLLHLKQTTTSSTKAKGTYIEIYKNIVRYQLF